MTQIYHPHLGKLEDYALLSVASYFHNSAPSPLLQLFSHMEFKQYPEMIENHAGFSSSDLTRAKAIESCFCIPQFVLASKGGYGSIRSIESVRFKKDWEGILCGFSDLTVLINYLATKTKVACFHGPMFNYPKVWERDSFLYKSFEAFFCSKKFEYSDSFEGEFLQGSEICGELFGGNLSVICSMIGTPFEIDLKDKVLFIEEVNEASYKVDRMLMQLSLQKGFSDLKGLIFGQFTDCSPRPLDCGDLEIYPMVQSYLKKWDFPVLWNAPIGHVKDFVIIPIGGESTWALGDNKQIEFQLSYPKNI
ncbi:MAG: LD-carboxypeptidase [Candidatus Cloacimonetes bacterium]|nr:LD-carboxypeptidase [Candidatus Cloacimonadota bacterium]